jgi:hypothetical protein
MAVPTVYPEFGGVVAVAEKYGLKWRDTLPVPVGGFVIGVS